jgi:hypothetical protein
MAKFILFDCMGSDQLVHCDGRWGFKRCQEFAQMVAERKSRVAKITKATLCEGNLRNYREIHTFPVFQ